MTTLLALVVLWQFRIENYKTYIAALENRRAFFKRMGATATDHAAVTAYTGELSPRQAETIFRRALTGKATAEDATRFTGHMLMEMARMSIEDGLVMQLHVGSFRNHNPLLYERFGTDMGADIPTASEFTRNLRPLLSKYGNETRLTLILFNLDESTYSRELAPLAGHYPALRLGPPWWFFDSLNGAPPGGQGAPESQGMASEPPAQATTIPGGPAAAAAGGGAIPQTEPRPPGQEQGY